MGSRQVVQNSYHIDGHSQYVDLRNLQDAPPDDGLMPPDVAPADVDEVVNGAGADESRGGGDRSDVGGHVADGVAAVGGSSGSGSRGVDGASVDEPSAAVGESGVGSKSSGHACSSGGKSDGVAGGSAGSGAKAAVSGPGGDDDGNECIRIEAMRAFKSLWSRAHYYSVKREVLVHTGKLVSLPTLLLPPAASDDTERF